MNRNRFRSAWFFVIAMFFLVLAFSRPQSRTVWIALAAVAIMIGLVQRRRRQPPAANG